MCANQKVHPLCRVTVDLGALQANYLQIHAHAGRIAPPAGCPGAKKPRAICVVKANGYGHGALPCAKALSAVGADFFAVATAEEALSLRTLLPRVDILVLSPIDPLDAPALAQEGITATVGCEDALRAYAAAVRRAWAVRGLPRERSLLCHIKLDSGMHRHGFPCCTPKESRLTAYAIRSLSPIPGVRITGLYAHPAKADAPTCAETEGEVRAFCRMHRLLGDDYFYHFASSATAISLGSLGFAGYRPGLALYGYLPGEGLSLPPGLFLRAVARVETRLTRVFWLKTGQTLGYGGSFRATRPMQVGVAAIGYADGLPRAASGAWLAVHGQPAKIIGRVCMDCCMLDLTGIKAAAGDRVVVAEESGHTLSSLARHAHTIPYELLCHLPGRAAWQYLPGLE